MGTKDPKTSASTWARLARQKAIAYTRGEPIADANVPCGDCNACCRCGYEVEQHPGDDPTLRWVPSENGGLALERDSDGACVYAQEGGCAVYDRRPETCRRYDCRGLAIIGLMGTEYPILNEAVDAWDLKKTIKTTKDRVVLTALRMALAGRFGLKPVEDLIWVSLRRYPAFMDHAWRVLRHTRSQETPENKNQ